MDNLHQFVRVEFERFKAFNKFSLELKHFNIMVGPNNAGKSTILAAFRILAAALRRATSKKAASILGPHGRVMGYSVDLSVISVAEENIFYNYDASCAAQIKFTLSNGNSLVLFFPESGVCFLLPEAHGRAFSSPALFRKQFNCPIGFVPILGPVEHNEPLYEKEAARLALFSYRAARNFRNIWYHYPDLFEKFRDALKQTWPGMDIEPPEVDRSYEKPRLHMYCPEKRIPRELFWAGFGFQVWCQMLTHIIQSQETALFMIDEPDIYLHAELQRQLISLLRNLGPDILLATHSTEIITEAEADDILMVNKEKRSARRLKNPRDVGQLFENLGSNINPILTQLAKTRRVLFVEGKDYQILGRFALRVGERSVANRTDFAVVPVEGFNTERIRSLKQGMETTLGAEVIAGAILDRDYRSSEECQMIREKCRDICSFISVHNRKEIENYLLVPSALDRAIKRRILDKVSRGGSAPTFEPFAEEVLEAFALDKKAYLFSQVSSEARRFSRSNADERHETEIIEQAFKSLERDWDTPEGRYSMLPGKDAISNLNRIAQERYGVSITPTAIVEAMTEGEIPSEMRSLISELKSFSRARLS